MESKHEFSESVQSAISQIKTSNKLSKKLKMIITYHLWMGWGTSL